MTTNDDGFRCRARRYSDQMHCAVCRLTWDTNDENPPQCGRGRPVVIAAAAVLGVERLPFVSGLR
jgi:hypothetical protein